MKLRIPKDLTKTKYRHGDLRRSVIEITKIIVRQKKHFEFSIQDIAALSGVSRVAIYRYFKTPEEILQAIAIEGFKGLVASFQQAQIRDLSTLGAAYIAFGMKNPAEYRTMFMNDVRQCKNKELASISALAFETLHQSFGKSKSSRTEALAVWSLVHGFVMLSLDGLVDSRKSSKEWELLKEKILLLGSKAKEL